MADGMNYVADTQSQKECKASAIGKLQQKPFPKQSQDRATRPYEIVYNDGCDPMQVESKGGSKCMFTFTDDLSWYTTAYFIKPRVKFFWNSWNMLILFRNIRLWSWTFLQRKMLKFWEVTMEESTHPTSSLRSVQTRDVSSLFHTVHSKMVLLDKWIPL